MRLVFALSFLLLAGCGEDVFNSDIHYSQDIIEVTKLPNLNITEVAMFSSDSQFTLCSCRSLYKYEDGVGIVGLSLSMCYAKRKLTEASGHLCPLGNTFEMKLNDSSKLCLGEDCALFTVL